MVVALIALVFSLTGGAVAATLITGADIKNRSVTKKDIKPNAVRSKHVRAGSLLAADFKLGEFPGTGPQGPEGPRGEKGEPGEDGTSTTRWALINKAHTEIIKQSGGISIAGTFGAGTYLDMGADVDGKVIQATTAYTADDGDPSGSPQALICGGGYGSDCTLDGTNNTRHVWVLTLNAANTDGENHAVYVAVF
jgi:hypothetical protein